MAGITGLIPQTRPQKFDLGLEEIFKQIANNRQIQDAINYHKGDIGLRREASGRAAELQPFQKMLLQAKASSAQSNADWNNMIMGRGNSPTNNNASSPQQNNDRQALKDHIMQMNGQGPRRVTDTGYENSNNPGESTEGPGTINNGNPFVDRSGYNQPQQNNQGGQETIIQPGNPNMLIRDQYAGIKGIPPVQTHYENGILYKIKPSGEITATPVGQTKEQAEQTKLNVKERQDLEKEIPVVEDRLKNVKKLINMIKTKKADPNWFGSGAFGLDILGGPNQRERSIRDPEYAKMKTLFASLVAPMSQELSSRGLKSALDYAIGIKPGFNENIELALGKLEQIESNMEQNVKRERSRLGTIGGNKQKELTYNPETGRLE